jgi:DNA-binding CsgD family transcriptional regulator
MEARASEYQQDGKIYSVVILREIFRPGPWESGLRQSPAGSNRSDGVITSTPQRRLETRNGSVLTSREIQVLTLVAQGKSTKEVAAILGISVKTADSHRTHLMEKLKVHETASVVRFAIRAGLVEP